ncbi:adenylate isopentenyltransferase-like [Argentina anserina]|uniref:adenylate isopentenyltransferase-like n=1 Tax=Argentina anserina TaxID=57926 RepID=UPI0021767A50|nr:adenylate isopentenyltransferase-like [Potentilla anserina]
MTLNPFPTHQYYNITTFPHYLSTSPPVNFTPPPSLHHKPRWARMDAGPASTPHHRKDKVVVIMGATGAGKSSLSIDLATRFPFCFEVINSDKIQVYKGLDITTNKIPLPDRQGVPHHLLGELDPLDGELSPTEFRHLAGRVVSDIRSRRRVPMLVGGSNSLIHALLVERFEPGVNVFENGAELVSSELRYDCCFLWVDVSLVVLAEYLSKRVDEMLESGMFKELAEFCDDDDGDSEVRTGLRKAIGVPEFGRFFKKYPPAGRSQCCQGAGPRDPLREGAAYNDAVRAIKDNTCQLAKKQIGKIRRLKGAEGWDLRRLDATEAFRAVMTSDSDVVGRKWSEIWEEQVVEPSVKIVKQFLEE